MKRNLRKTVAVVLAVALLFSAFAVTASAKDSAEVIKGVLRSPILFEDLAKLVEAVKTGDPGKEFMCVLETYPDIIAEIRKNMEIEDTGSVVSVGDVVLVAALISLSLIAAAVLITFCVMRKKMKRLLNLQKAAAGWHDGEIPSET